MITFALTLVLASGPIGIDFSAFPAEPTFQKFELWDTVHAADGSTLDNSRWAKFSGEWTRDELMAEVAAGLKDGGCVVERRGSVLVVRELNGSPVTFVEVRVISTGAGPLSAWALRSPPVAPNPRAKK